MTITSILLIIIIAAVVEGIIRIVKFNRKKAKEALEFRKSEFPNEVKYLIGLYLFRNVFRKDSKLALAALNSTEKILDYLGLGDIGDREDEEILRIVRSVQPPMYVLHVLEANFDVILKVKEKAEERSVLLESIFEKVFPKLNFELWDMMDYWKQRRLINEILEGMESRGELKPIDKISGSEENLVNQ